MLCFLRYLKVEVNAIVPQALTSNFCTTVTTNDNTQRRKSLKGEERKTIVSLETSLRYMESTAYQTTYGDQPVWVQYRRNHKGQIPPRKTRETCIRKGMLFTGNPCPICRDEYLLLHEKNPKLLKQFISEHTGQIISYSKTGICQKKHKELIVAVRRAWDQGVLTFDVPFREYDYSDYITTSTNC